MTSSSSPLPGQTAVEVSRTCIGSEFLLTLSLPLGRHNYDVFGKVNSVQFVCCYLMLNANFLRKFQLWVHSEANLSSLSEHFWSRKDVKETRNVHS